MMLPTRPSHDLPSRQPQCPVSRSAHARPKTKLKCLVLGATSAGKTSFVRRYFDRTFANDRVPTQGSDWYTKHLQYPLKAETEVEEKDRKDHADKGELPLQESMSISLQLWDTPGRERLDAKRPERRHQQLPSLHASFLQRADAYMLVYDVTSSTSFKQLLKWYVDLIGLIEKTTEDEQITPASSYSLPILIVGTKVDLLRSGDSISDNSLRPISSDRRSVLGLQEKDWKGHNYQYEYQISTAEPAFDTVKSNHVTPTTDFREPDFKLPNSNTRRMEISSYLADRENWTTDWGYLNGVLSSEDSSHPDRDMVKLWCARNNLKHMEASAATGQGVDEVIEELVKLAIRTKQHREVKKVQQKEVNNEEHQLQPQPPQSTEALLTESLRYNSKLDLHQRYAPKVDQCCLFRWFRCCRR